MPFITARARRAAAVALVAALPALAVPAVAGAGPGKHPKPLHATLLGAFAFGACPGDAPAGALCLHDRLSGAIKGIGPVHGEFDVAIDAARTGPDNVAPIAKHGSFTTADGDRLDMVASGTFDFTASVASYTYTITGGSGRFRAASGTGRWLVPAPSIFDPATGTGTGDEILDGTLLREH